jgi:hypothetical protein
MDMDDHALRLLDAPHAPRAPAIAARCLDRYFAERVKEAEGKADGVIDPRLTTIVERMLDRWVLPCMGG